MHLKVCTEGIRLAECTAVWRRARVAAPKDVNAEMSPCRSCRFIADTGGRRLQTPVSASVMHVDKEALFQSWSKNNIVNVLEWRRVKSRPPSLAGLLMHGPYPQPQQLPAGLQRIAVQIYCAKRGGLIIGTEVSRLKLVTSLMDTILAVPLRKLW